MINTADKSVMRWGGLASIGGGLLLILVFAIVIVIVLAGPDPAGPAGPISRFPDIKPVRTVENSLYLTVLLLWVPLFPALQHGLAGTRPAPALFGSALNILGLGVLAAGALPHVVMVGLSDRYHATGSSPSDQATLVLLWEATQGMFDALLLTGLLAMTVGVILLGLAMQAAPAFGEGVGRVSMLLGTAGLAAGTVTLIAPHSPAVALGLFALIAFHLILGWKLYRLSRTA